MRQLYIGPLDGPRVFSSILGSFGGILGSFGSVSSNCNLPFASFVEVTGLPPEADC